MVKPPLKLVLTASCQNQTNTFRLDEDQGASRANLIRKPYFQVRRGAKNLSHLIDE